MTEKEATILALKVIGKDWKYAKQWVASYGDFLHKFAAAAIDHEKRRINREERKKDEHKGLRRAG